MTGDNTPQLSKDDLEDLLHCKVEYFTSSMLTAPGENYGSTMLLVDVSLLPDHRKLSLAAKLVPASPHMRKMFKVEVTVRKEIYMYLLAWPELIKIHEECGAPQELFLNMIPKCHGARTTREGDIDLPVDESSVILLENLKASEYRMVDRIVGMDLKHAEYVVTRLARFHAAAIAVKLKNPRAFQNAVLKAASYISTSQFPGSKGPVDIVDSLLSIPLIAEHKTKLKEVIHSGLVLRRSEHQPETREPFATLVHDDFWTNNMMFSYGGRNGEDITGLKMLDFQSVFYGSPAIDLLFFLFTSTDLSMTKEHCDRLIILYYQEFIKCLGLLGCESEPFSYESFLEDVKSVTIRVFAHVFYMLRIICLSESKAPDLTKPSEIDEIFTDSTGFGEIYFNKTIRLVQEFLDRKWI